MANGRPGNYWNGSSRKKKKFFAKILMALPVIFVYGLAYAIKKPKAENVGI